MGAFVAAWLLGQGIIVYRSIRQTHLPPMPGALLASSGLFAGLALLAESQNARPLAVTLAWGFDAAALLNLFPTVTSGTGKPATTGGTSAAGTGPGTPGGGASSRRKA